MQKQKQRFITFRCITLYLLALVLNTFVHEQSLAAERMTGVAEKPAPKLVIIGASYARGWTIETTGNFRVINKGIDGEQTHQMLARYNEDVIKQRPATVLIWGFINDIFRSSREGVADKLTVTRKNILAMLAKAKAAGIRPVLATEVTITSPDRWSEKFLGWAGRLRGKQSYQDYVNAQVRHVNIWIRDLGREEAILVLDLERVLADDSGERQRRFATEDGSHLSAEAYAALTEYAKKTLR